MHLHHLTLPRTAQSIGLYSRLVANPYVEHQELWSMLGAEADAKRDFLYRSDITDKGFELYALAPSELAPPAPWVSRAREFDVEFKKGQMLSFSVRISPTYDKAAGTGVRSVRTDMVMERYRAAQGEVSVDEISQAVAQEWLGKRAAGAGFQLVEAFAKNYTRVGLTKKGQSIGTLAKLDIEGVLTVQDPELFLQKLRQGFGKSKFAGCGLMLVRRFS